MTQNQKTILITGASTGIGAEVAKLLAPGNRIGVHYNSSKTQAEDVAQEISNLGGEAELIQANLSNREGCAALVDAISQDWESIDVLVNNAGGLIKRQSADELEWSLMEDIFALNVFSVMQVTTLCLPRLKKANNASIINMTSIAMRHGAPTATIYGASKSAIDSFTRGLAKELAPEIRVNAVAPGIIETPFHDKVSTSEQMENWKKVTPLQKHGKAIHIAETVQFLIENDFITGETIDVNGGLWMR